MLPTLEKSWQYVVNQSFGSGSGYRSALRAIKNAMIGFASSPWLVGYSCGFNGTIQVAGTPGDAVDRWNADAALVWLAGGVRSWIVLTQANITSGFQLLIDLNAGSTAYSTASFYVSPSAGFTGGTTSARPTATDEIAISGVVGTGWGPATTSASRIHVAMSTDGQCTRIFVCSGNIVGGMWILDRIKAPRAGIALPFVAGVVSNSGGVNVVTKANLNDVQALRGKFSTTIAGLYMTGEGANGLLVGGLVSTADDIDSAYSVSNIGLLSTTSGARGRFGQLFDLFWGSSGPTNGDDYDETSNMVLAQMRDVLHPAGGVVWATA